MTQELQNIANQFTLDTPVKEINSLGAGFINDTFIAVSQSGIRYILQRKNNVIFTNVPAMMENIVKVSEHLKKQIVAAGGDPSREAMTIIPTTSGELCYKDDKGQEWAVCLFIEDTLAYTSVSSPALAEAGGRGIGKFQSMLSDFTTPLTNILPGFHEMDFRFKQWDTIIKNDPVGRASKVAKEIEWVEARREKMLEVWAKVKNGTIPTRVTHNDTKISNILFTPQGDVLCVIDLDTVLSATILNDFGDCVRTYTNTGEEDDTNLDKVTMSIEMFEGLTKGYLAEMKNVLTQSEIQELAYAGNYITTEQVLRFLMDYIDGDNYYKIKGPEHNLERTLAQIKLVESMEAQADKMKEIVAKYSAK